MIPRLARNIAILCAWCHCWLMMASGEPSSTTFENANRLYEEGKYAQAAAAYQELLDRPSAALFFNLGNAFFKSGQLGHAIAAYRQAQRLTPRDPDVQANLQFAREQSRGPRVPIRWWQRAVFKLTLNEWTMAVSAGLWAVLLLLSLGQWKPSLMRALRGGLVSLGLVTGFLAIGLVFAWQEANGGTTAVVVAATAEVRHGPLEESQTAFTAHDGAELRVLDRKDDWLRVDAGPQRSGWIKEDQVILL